MRILHVTKKYPNAIGGDSTCVFNLEKEQTKNGHQVFILTSNCVEIINKDNLFKFGLKDTSFSWDNVNVKRIISLLLFFFESVAVLKKTSPDIIHSHSSDLGFIISIWARFMRIPVINTCHGVTFPYHFLSKFKRFSEWFFLRFGFFDKIITVDANSLKFFKQYGIKNCEYLLIIGVDIKAFDKARERRKSAQENGIIRFIFVGRIDNLKGLDYLVCAINEVKYSFNDFEVLIIGEGPYQTALEELVGKFELKNYVKFLKAVTSRERLIELYCSSDIFVLPSLVEGFPITILEAWAAGLAVITTDVGGINAICKDRENALIVAPKDKDALAQAMLSLIKNEELRDKISGRGWQFAEHDYVWEVVSRRLEYMYNTLHKTRSNIFS